MLVNHAAMNVLDCAALDTRDAFENMPRRL